VNRYSPQPVVAPSRYPKRIPKRVVPSYIGEADQVLNLLMHEGTGDIVRDYSGQSNHGGVEGPKWTDEGIAAWALSFDGADDYVDLTGLTSTNKTYTLLMWSKSSMPDTSDWICTLDSESGRLIFAYQTTSTGIIGYYDGSWHDVGDTPNDGKPHHIGWVLDDGEGEGEIFIDGGSIGTAPYTGVDIGGTVYMGRSTAATLNYYDGIYASGRLYESALSGSEINEHYEATKPLYIG